MKQIFIACVLTFCTFQTIAQIHMPGTVGGPGYVNGTFIGGTSIVIGTSPSTTSSNVIIGNGTGNLNTAGANTFIGQAAATSNTTGYANTFLGRWCAQGNTTGFANTFLGQWSGPANTTGNHNVFVGQGSASQNTTGGDNSFLGQGAGPNNITGYQNTFIGKLAGQLNAYGNSNTAIGFSAGFSGSSWVNSTAIGANATAGASNTMVLGPNGSGGTTRVNVGIGTSTPSARIHTEGAGYENVKFSTLSNFTSSTLNMNAGINNSYYFMNGSSYSGSYLPSIVANSAPAVPNAYMAGLVTDGAPITIGIDGSDKSGSVHFMNWVNGGRAECMRINKTNGFVGVHTRSAATANSTGEPQTLFHVNLTNPLNPNFDPLTKGIRFEGLPSSQPRHTKVVVVDPSTGDLAMDDPGGTSNAWLLNGNNTTGTEFIGTLLPDDLRIYTNGVQAAMVTKEGNFDVGSLGSNAIVNSTATSATIGENNILDAATSTIEVGRANTIRNTQYSAAFGDGNSIELNSIACQTTGKNNTINDADYSMTAGNQNTINMSSSVLAGGTDNLIENSEEVFVHGDGTHVDASYASGAIGEENEMFNGHGCFIGGGHNFADGWYNFIGGSNNTINGGHNFIGGHTNTGVGEHNILLGNHLIGDITSSTPVPANNFDPNPYLMMIGERINSDLARSLSIGFNGNRTSVTTERGMSVQIDPTLGNTDIPVVNFEVEAGVTTTGRQPLSGMGVLSNVRFHNLPLDPLARPLPAVLIDPNTGELFQSQNLYMKPGKGDSGANLDSLYKENESLKDRINQLESQVATIPQLQSQISMYDEKFAQIERYMNQICESGCAGLKAMGKDELFQSVPNPSDNNATIKYHLSRDYTQANIILYNMNGTEVGVYNLTPNMGDGSVNVTIGELQSGIYLYRLVVDGNSVDVKKLQKQ